MRLLATKILSENLKIRLLHHGFSVVEYPFIHVIPLNVKVEKIHEHVIFTSQNAVRLAYDNHTLQPLLANKKFHCVGEKTAAMLIEKGGNVLSKAANAKALGQYLSTHFKTDSFSFLCGQMRMSDLENQFKIESRMEDFEVIEVYHTELQPKTIEGHFNGILFYSPSAVKSFFLKNRVPESVHCFCIGPTTAKSLVDKNTPYSVAKTADDSQMLLMIKNFYSA